MSGDEVRAEELLAEVSAKEVISLSGEALIDYWRGELTAGEVLDKLFWYGLAAGRIRMRGWDFFDRRAA